MLLTSIYVRRDDNFFTHMQYLVDNKIVVSENKNSNPRKGECNTGLYH